MIEVKRIVNDLFTSNTYVLFDNDYDYCWLVDIGDYYKVVDVLPSGVTVRGVFLTHTHFDHIYGLNELYRRWPEVRVYAADFGCKSLYDDKMNLSRYHKHPILFEGKDVVVMREGDEKEIYPEVKMIAYEMPGHSLDSMCYMMGEWLFTGDAYIPGVKVVTKLPGGNRKQATQSIERIMVLGKSKTICPGHGEEFNILNKVYM